MNFPHGVRIAGYNCTYNLMEIFMFSFERSVLLPEYLNHLIVKNFVDLTALFK